MPDSSTKLIEPGCNPSLQTQSYGESPSSHDSASVSGMPLTELSTLPKNLSNCEHSWCTLHGTQCQQRAKPECSRCFNHLSHRHRGAMQLNATDWQKHFFGDGWHLAQLRKMRNDVLWCLPRMVPLMDWSTHVWHRGFPFKDNELS